jgi:hypothetical protein
MKEAPGSSETSVLQDPHGVTSQKTPFFIVAPAKTSNLTSRLQFVTFDLVALQRNPLDQSVTYRRFIRKLPFSNIGRGIDSPNRDYIVVSSTPSSRRLDLFQTANEGLLGGSITTTIQNTYYIHINIYTTQNNTTKTNKQKKKTNQLTKLQKQ